MHELGRVLHLAGVQARLLYGCRSFGSCRKIVSARLPLSGVLQAGGDGSLARRAQVEAGDLPAIAFSDCGQREPEPAARLVEHRRFTAALRFGPGSHELEDSLMSRNRKIIVLHDFAPRARAASLDAGCWRSTPGHTQGNSEA